MGAGSTPTDPPITRIRVSLLGATEVVVDDERLAVPGDLTRLLFTFLALQPGRPVSADRCIDELWGENLPAKPKNALQARVSELRRILGSQAIRSSSGSYVLEVDRDDVDAFELATLVDRMHRELAMGDLARAREDAERAQTLIRGAPLLDVAGGDWIEGERRRLRELVSTADELRIEARLAAGEYELVVDEAVAAVATDPLRERRWAQLMRALYGAGRPSDALRAFQDARRTLAEELGVDPGPELLSLERDVLDHAPGLAPRGTGWPLAPPDRARRETGCLPSPRTALIGRDDEVASLCALAATRELVTLTGPGGAGKTRLAVEVARRLAESGDYSARFVDLAAIDSGEDVESVFAEAVGLLDATGSGEELLDRLVVHLGTHPCLLVVDNCEHVVEAAAAVVDAVLAESATRILATSREPLGLPVEHQWPVPTLRTPLAADPDPAGAPAVALFVARARQADPAFEPDDASLELVAELVRALDGLPLAIELAASRVRAIGLRALVERLDGMLDLLTDGPRTARPRQRALRSLIDWSYGLLFQEEQAVFRRLGVFAGPFDLGLAEDLCVDDRIRRADVAALVGRLTDKSMVSRDSSGRHRLLDPLRHFALEQLEASGELPALRDRHAEVFLERIDEDDGLLRTDRLVEVLDRVEDDQPEYRSALRWVARTADDARHARFVARLGWFWFLRDHSQAARHEIGVWRSGARAPDDPVIWFLDAWFALDEWSVERARAAAERAVGSSDATTAGRAHAVQALATLGVGTRLLATPRPVTDVRRALEISDHARALCTEQGDAWGRGLTLLVAATAHLCDGAYADAADRAVTAAAVFEPLGDLWGVAKGGYLQGIAQLNLGDTDGAEATTRAALQIADELGHADTLAALMQHLGAVHIVQGRLDEARPLIDRAIQMGRRLGALPSIAYPLNLAGIVERRTGDADEAAHLHQQALRLYERTPLPLGPVFSRICMARALGASGRFEEAISTLALVWDTPELEEPRTRAAALEALASARIDEPARAARLLGAAAALRDRPARVPAVPLPDRGDLDELSTRVRDLLSASVFEEQCERGRVDADELDERP